MRVLVLLLLLIPTSSFANRGIWLSNAEIMARPMSGTPWNSMKARADTATSIANISCQDNQADVNALAMSLVYARTGTESYRTACRALIMSAIGTESDVEAASCDGEPNRTLALGRNLCSFVIAADIVGLTAGEDNDFRYWLRGVLWKRFVNSGDDDTTGSLASLKNTHQLNPNNWGTMAGASLAAVAVYLDSTNILTGMLQQVATTFKGWVGSRSTYAGFHYDSDLTWQLNPTLPVAINPVGAVKSGRNIDGSLPEEMRRGHSFVYPPWSTGYPWEALQGAVVQAEILKRAGYNPWEWENKGIKRAAQYLYALHAAYPDSGWAASGDDRWQTWLLNYNYYGSTFPVENGASAGKLMAWTAWTHAVPPVPCGQ